MHAARRQLEWGERGTLRQTGAPPDEKGEEEGNRDEESDGTRWDAMGRDVTHPPRLMCHCPAPSRHRL